MLATFAASAPIQPPAFNAAVAGLRAIRRPAARYAVACLDRLRIPLKAAKILKRYGPPDPNIDELLNTAFRDLGAHADENFVAVIEDRAVELLGNLFPINEYAMEEAFYNRELDEPLLIVIANPGFFYTYDDFDQAVRDPEYWGEDNQLLCLAALLSVSVDEEDWDRLAAFWKWPPAEVDHSVICDGEILERLLNEAGLPDVIAAFHMVWQETGSIFLDYNDEQIYEMFVPFEADNIPKLLEEWEKAKPVLEAYRRAVEQVKADPDLIERIVHFWNQSGGGRPPKNQTLAELWHCGDLPDDDDIEDPDEDDDD